MSSNAQTAWIAFGRNKCIGSGTPREVATAAKAFVEANSTARLLVFDAITSQPVEIDLRGSLAAVLKRLPAPTAEAASPVVAQTTETRTVGRPKLGVTAREVTLLPRHWEWLAAQPGGASVVLRKLVEHAQRVSGDVDRVRQAREAAYRFINAMAGNEPGFEEATRALFAGDLARFREQIAKWPADIRKHALALAAATTVKHGEKEPVT
jgi:uncharacterized protein